MSGCDDAQVEEMFVQVSRQVIGDAHSFSLVGLAPTTLYFSDRPERVVGHMTTAQFLDQWDRREDSFAADPPNAVLAYYKEGSDVPDEVVVVLSDPVAQQDSLRYGAEVLEGEIPDRAGACTLFIDPLGRPLSPQSLAGMSRSARRRRRRIL